MAKAAQQVKADDPTTANRSPKHVGRQLRHVRRKQGLSRAEVARSAGLTRRELAAYERGRVEIPDSDLWCLAGSCGVDVGELLPQRNELRVDSGLSSLAIGESIRHLRAPVESDGMLREYLGMIYELRNLPPGSQVPMRETDLSALADALGGNPEAIESRLVELVGANREEAARLRAMILPPRSLDAGEISTLPAAPAGGTAESFAAALDSALTPELEDFFAAPRADDPFSAPPPLEPLAEQVAPPFDDGAPLLASDPMAEMPVDPFATPPPGDGASAEASEPEGELSVTNALAGLRPDPFAPSGNGASAAPETEIEIDFDGIVVDMPEPRDDAAADDLSPTAPGSELWAAPDPESDAQVASRPETEPVTDFMTDLMIGVGADVETDADAESDQETRVATDTETEPETDTETEPETDAMSELVAGDAVEGWAPAPVEDDEPIEPIVWHAASAQPLPDAPPAGADRPARFAHAGSGWQVGGMFPATAMADDGALALRRADTRWALSDLSAPGDVQAEAIVDFTAGPGFGILFRAGLDGHEQLYGYSFDVDAVAGGGSYLVRQWEANRPHWRPLAQAQVVDPTRLLGRRTVALSIRGDSLSAEVDGDPVLTVSSLSHASIELGREPCRGERLGIQAAASTEVTVDRLSATQQ